ncbi:response regulator receiver domain-containing protein [Flavobacterium chryseum]|nr:response regulator receiver domain-containing protein [Flavobacterium sp. P3160]
MQVYSTVKKYIRLNKYLISYKTKFQKSLLFFNFAMMGYKTIFHIDDDDDDIIFFVAAIEYLSATTNCFSFTNANKALQKLITSELIPDAIFLDINMPVINGPEFLAILKTTPGLKEIPVIILSTSADPITMDQLKAAGAAGFLTKPPSLKELIDILHPYLI